MNSKSLRATFLALLPVIAVAKLALVGMPVQAQPNQPPALDRLDALVGTWTATAPGEQIPFLVLKLRESDGKLTGTASHFKLVSVQEKPAGTPEPGESPIADLTLEANGDFGFVWDSDPILRGDGVMFYLRGTKEAELVISVADPGQFEKIRDENQQRSGFTPVIALRREAAPEPWQGEKDEKWVPSFLAMLINTAEAQYKFIHGTYTDYETLVQSGQLKEAVRQFKVPPNTWQSVDDPLPGYSVRLLTSPNSSSYELSIREKNAECGADLFSDETGVIAEGRPDGCTAK